MPASAGPMLGNFVDAIRGLATPLSATGYFKNRDPVLDGNRAGNSAR